MMQRSPPRIPGQVQPVQNAVGEFVLTSDQLAQLTGVGSRIQANIDITGLTQQQVQQLILARLERIAPTHLFYVIVPGDGDVGLAPPGVTKIDLRNQVLITPERTTPISANKDLLKEIQSVQFFVDSPVTIDISPGFGQAPTFNGVSAEFGARTADYVQFSTPVPCVFIAVFSSGLAAPVGRYLSVTQDRVSTFLPVKINPAGTADNLTPNDPIPVSVPMTVRNGLRTLSQAQFATNYIITAGVGQKVYHIRNTGAVGVDVAVYGTMFLDTALGLQGPPNNSNAWTEDPDIKNSVVGSPVNIPAGSNAVLETGIPWGFMQLRARVAAAGNGAGTTGQILVEYFGMNPMVR